MEIEVKFLETAHGLEGRQTGGPEPGPSVVIEIDPEEFEFLELGDLHDILSAR